MIKYKLVLMDMDGVVWRGKEPLRQNIEAIKFMQEQGLRIVFFTNNSSRTRIEYFDRLKSLGLNINYEDVLTSGFLAAEYLVSKNLNTVFVVGENGLVEELVLKGIHVVVDKETVDAVVVGIDRFLTYNKLSRASHYIRMGALFIATNTDATYPSEKGEEPGAGSIIGALTVATGRSPDFVAGKPNTWVIDYILKKHHVNKHEILVVGDRLDTDIELGRRAGVDTLLVLTGVTRPNDGRISKYNPTYVVNDLKEFINVLKT
ncbi:HAD-IIA family hydrolase [Desulfurococcaceae archaeon MEX13E-LK6-19]|nr:HAD-IIA family hydrolase [Desulfurococcaceae archaeon MEX13E-LK6-19]